MYKELRKTCLDQYVIDKIINKDPNDMKMTVRDEAGNQVPKTVTEYFYKKYGFRPKGTSFDRSYSTYIVEKQVYLRAFFVLTTAWRCFKSRKRQLAWSHRVPQYSLKP